MADKRVSAMPAATPNATDRLYLSRAPNDYALLWSTVVSLFAPVGHVSDTSNPHAVTAAQAGADPAGSAAGVQANLTAHEADLANPHAVTAAQAGADPSGSAAGVQANLTAHEADLANPHAVTAAQAGADPAGSAATVQGNLDTHTGDASIHFEDTLEVTTPQARLNGAWTTPLSKVPVGGATGEALVKTSAADYAVDWAAVGDVTNPLSGNLATGGFDIIGTDAPGGNETFRLDASTGSVFADGVLQGSDVGVTGNVSADTGTVSAIDVTATGRVTAADLSLTGNATFNLPLSAGNEAIVLRADNGDIELFNAGGNRTIHADASLGVVDVTGALLINGAALAGGGGQFKGDNGTVGTQPGDIFRVNNQSLGANVTIDADENAAAAGPLAVSTGFTLTVTAGGNLVIL